jgi:hypothetical protein
MFQPPRLLPVLVTSISNNLLWTTMDTSGTIADPWVNYPYQWNVVMTVTPQQHSYPLSQTPYYYNGLDISVGDWYSDLASGKAVQVISITSQTASSATLVVQDVERYNTFTDPTGQGLGIGSTGSGYLFQLSDDALPILTPMSTLATSLNSNLAWQLDQLSRFRYRNMLSSHVSVYQSGNSFTVGETIYLQTSGAYAVVPSGSVLIKNAVGIISDVGIPGPGYFTYRPIGKIIKNFPITLPGNAGDLVYLASMGGYTNSAPSTWARPIYINLGNNSVMLLQTSVDAVGTRGYSNQINVVSTLSNLPTSPQPGDQAYVSDSDSGSEWSQQIYNGTSWNQLVSETASKVDAETLQGVVSSSETYLGIGQVSANRCVTIASVQVTQAFNSGITLNIGTTSTVNAIMDASLIDLTKTGTYSIRPNIVLNTSGSYTAIFASLSGSISQGSATINVTYI